MKRCAERRGTPRSTSAGAPSAANTTYAAVVGSPIPSTTDPSAVRRSAGKSWPPDNVMMSSDILSPIPVSEATPTTIPAAAHAAATWTAPRPARSMISSICVGDGRVDGLTAAMISADVTPQNAARIGERPIPSSNTMMIRGNSRWRRSTIDSDASSSAGSIPMRPARKWIAARRAV